MAIIGLGQASCSAAVVQESIASELLSLAHVVNDQAAGLRERVEKRLDRITLSANQKAQVQGDAPEREYPQLFNELRSILRGIQNSLDGIDDNISRTAL